MDKHEDFLLVFDGKGLPKAVRTEHFILLEALRSTLRKAGAKVVLGSDGTRHALCIQLSAQHTYAALEQLVKPHLDNNYQVSTKIHA